MRRDEVRKALDELGESRAKWTDALREYREASSEVLSVLLMQSARLYLSVDEVSRRTGIPTRRVRKLMRDMGVNPRANARALSQAASDAIIENSEKLGVGITEIDLMSPLAYLPAGDDIQGLIVTKGKEEE